MKKGLKIFLIIVAIGLITAVLSLYWAFNMPHRDIQGETPAYTLAARELYNEFSKDEGASTLIYTDKVVQVDGEIAELYVNGCRVSLVLNHSEQGISCSLDSAAIELHKDCMQNLAIGDHITLKGKCDGYDEIMGVVLTQCFIVE